MDVDESDADPFECSEFNEELEISDSEICGAKVSFVSNGSTLIGECPAPESAPKICSRHRCVEGMVKNGVNVVFDVNPKTGKKYAHCRSCRAYVNEISNPKNNHKNNPKNNLKRSQDVADGLICKRCYHAKLTQDEKDTQDGCYCHNCRKKYGCGGGFDSNSHVLRSLLVALMPSLVLISSGKGIPGSATPWSGYMVKPDIVFQYSLSLVVVVEADEDDGYSELAKMQTAAQALHQSYRKSILYVRCNSDNTSLRLGDAGLSERARMVVEKIRAAQSSIAMWPPNSFRLALVDMPLSRVQSGTPIQDTDDVYISWYNIQQTINPTDPSVLKEITRQETIARKERRALRSYNQ